VGWLRPVGCRTWVHSDVQLPGSCCPCSPNVQPQELGALKLPFIGKGEPAVGGDVQRLAVPGGAPEGAGGAADGSRGRPGDCRAGAVGVQSQHALRHVRRDVSRSGFGEREVAGAKSLGDWFGQARAAVRADRDTEDRVAIGDGDPDPALMGLDPVRAGHLLVLRPQEAVLQPGGPCGGLLVHG